MAAAVRSLADAPEVGMRRRVFDLPPMAVRVTEHQLIARRCDCGITTCGSAPEGVIAPVQFGTSVSDGVRSAQWCTGDVLSGGCVEVDDEYLGD